MSNPSLLPSSNAKPYPWLLKSQDIRVLWMLRILLKLGVFAALYHSHHSGRSARIARRLGLPLLESPDDARKPGIRTRLEASLRRIESRPEAIKLPSRLQGNIDFLRRQFSLNTTECLVLALAVYLRVDDDLHEAAVLDTRKVNPAREIAIVLGIPQSRVAKALEPMGRLRRSGMIMASSGGNMESNLQLRRGGLRKLATSTIRNAEDMFGGFLASAGPATLSAEDYAHMTPGFSVLERLLRDALVAGRIGVNILVYGAPGTGKSELPRTLAKYIDVPLFDIASQDEDGIALNAPDRLGAAATGLFLLGKRKAIVAFDEVEAIFNDGSDFVGKPSTAESAKAWVNRILEQNPAPVLWIANNIQRMDPAFVRRFDLVIQLESPPQAQRLNLLKRECAGLLPVEQLRQLSRVEHITPALVTRTSKVVRRIGDGEDSGKLLRTVLDGVLKAQGHGPLDSMLRANDMSSFDPSFWNASEDMSALADGLATSGIGRFCLYGPPGTGKTAFGHWLADKLGRSILLKRASDLQSPYLGIMEKNLARAFEQAARDGAILQIDEVDGFLQDRRGAEHPWEVSQVNEFLTQLEGFDGLFIASTNLIDNLDQAALRRFDFKIRMDYLRPDQAISLLQRNLAEWGIDPATADDHIRLSSLKLTPGDFSVIARRHRVKPFVNTASIVAALYGETMLGGRVPTNRIGFT